MLRITVSKSASGAKKYYSDSYYKEGKEKRLEYYLDKYETIGKWGGKASEKLGLGSEINKSDFDALCDNKRPDNDKSLTGRTKDGRRVGYDFTFNASKSISLAHAFGSSEDRAAIEKAFMDSVGITMSELEKNMQARVRDNGKDENRLTGNILYGEFTHYTSRPVDGVPDPHLHAHCFVFNATFDKESDKWKAGQFGQIIQDAPYYESYFHAQLAQNLQKVGYEIEQKKYGIELKGVDTSLIDKFSRRTKEIEAFAREKDITDEQAKSELGALTRENKRTEVSREQQFKIWGERLTKEELETLKTLRKDDNADNSTYDNEAELKKAKEAIDYSLKHHLERKSVVSDKEILATSLKYSLNKITPEQAKQALNERRDVLQVNDKYRTLLTTKEALNEEKQLIKNAVSFRGNMPSINRDYKVKNEQFNNQQKEAVHHTLTTYDGLVIITGKAGVGKTTIMKEVKMGILSSGKKIFAYAPSADASRGVQRADGFQNANTVASLIHNKDKQPELKNQVLWVDEAGLLSNKQMNKIFKIAKEQEARIILSGDTKQHNSVERGDALRVIQEHAKIKSVTVSKLQRQKNQDYKEAVSHLSKGDVDRGFTKLDRMGAIHEADDHNNRADMIANDYYNSISKGKPSRNNVLVVSPTHAEGDLITEKIRVKLKKENLLSKQEKKFKTLENLQYTEAEKGNIDSYSKGQYLVFHQRIKDIEPTSKLLITGKENNHLIATSKDGKDLTVPIDAAKHYNVFEQQNIDVAKGDKIRITNNAKDMNGKMLHNGTLHHITGFTKNGDIRLSNGSTIAKDFNHFKLGYVSTSHSSQGKTVNKVIISQSSMSLRAASMEQFYVSVSRGRNAVSIYTDNKADLLNAIRQTSKRMSATELYARAPLMHKMNFNGKLMMDKARIQTAKAYQQTKNAINRHNERIRTNFRPPPPPRGRGR